MSYNLDNIDFSQFNTIPMPDISVPNIPNMGQEIRTHFQKSQQELQQANEKLISIKAEVSSIAEENKSLKVEVKKLQKESFWGIVGAISGAIGTLLAIISILK